MTKNHLTLGRAPAVNPVRLKAWGENSPQFLQISEAEVRGNFVAAQVWGNSQLLLTITYALEQYLGPTEAS